MNCGDSKKHIYQMLDGEAPDAVKAKLARHLEGCSVCQGELKSIEAFHTILRSPSFTIEPYKNFERLFWQKVLERQKEPWFFRLLKELDSLIPHPGMPRVAMVILMAFLVGGMGGVVSAMNSVHSPEAERTSVRYLSGFREFKGMPSSSVAASYLKSIDDRSSS